MPNSNNAASDGGGAAVHVDLRGRDVEWSSSMQNARMPTAGELRSYMRCYKTLLHDTIPTGPPCRTPPMRLRGEEADWVDAQLQAEVVSGQLERGNSEWAPPPFATRVGRASAAEKAAPRAMLQYAYPT